MNSKIQPLETSINEDYINYELNSIQILYYFYVNKNERFLYFRNLWKTVYNTVDAQY